MLDNYISMLSDAKYKTIHGKGRPLDLVRGLKLLTPEQLNILSSYTND